MSEIERSTSPQDETASRAASVSQIVAINSLAFTALGLYLASQTEGAWQAYAIALLSLSPVIGGFVAASIIRRGQQNLGGWVLFTTDWIAPALASWVIAGFSYVSIAYILIATYFIITQAMPKESRRAAWINTAVVLLIPIASGIIDPAWLLVSSLMLTVAPILTALLGAALVVIVGRQVWAGSMRNKLLVAFIGIVLVATGALGISVASETTRFLEESLERELSSLAVDRATRVGDLFNEQINALTTLSLNEVLLQAVEKENLTYEGNATAIQAALDAKDAQWRAADAANDNTAPLVQERLTNNVALDLSEYKKVFPDNIEVFITDVYGGLAGSTNRTSDYYQADEGWWQAAYNNGEGAVYLSDPEFDESAGEIGVQIALPLRSRDTGEVVGILRTTYLISSLKTILSEAVGETGSTDLYVPGETDIHIHEGLVEPADPEIVEQLQAVANQGLVEMDYEGTFSVVTQAPIQTLEGNPAVDNLGWIITFHQDRDEAFNQVSGQIEGIIYVTIIILVIAVAAAFVLAQFMVRPIVQLTVTAQEVSSGNLNSRAEATSSDEIGTLATAFNSMTSQLQTTLQGLEQRVADRTKAIATSSEVSRRLSTILNRQELVNEVVSQVQGAFGYYHAHIYLTEGDDLVLAGGTGSAGAEMLASGHKVQKGRGLVGRAAETNQVVLVPDTSQEEGWLPNPLLPETRAETAIPISIGDEILGVLDVQHDVTDGLGQEDVDTLGSIANQVAIALQNIASAETVAKRAVELQTVATISTATATIQDVQEMLATVVHQTQRQFGLYHAHVFTLDEATQELRIRACGYKEGDEHEGTHGTTSIPIAQEQSLVARAARTKQAVIVNDVHNEPGWLPNPLLPDTRAELAVPLILGNTVLGVLDVQSEHLNAFTEEDASIQTTLASQIAAALQNARSFTNAQHQAERETKLNLISQKIQQTATIEEAMQIAARELGHALGQRKTMVQLNATALTGKENPVGEAQQQTSETPELTETGVAE